MKTEVQAMNELTEFERAIYCLIREDGLGEALAVQSMTNEQKESFEKIKEIFLEQTLKDGGF